MELKKLLELAVVPFLLLVALWVFGGMLPQYYQLLGIYAWFWNGLLLLVIYLLIYVLTGYFVAKKFGRQEAFGVVFTVSLAAALGYMSVSFVSSLEGGYNSVSPETILAMLFDTLLLTVASLIVDYPAALIGIALAESQKEKKDMKTEDNKTAILRAIVCLALALVSSYYMFLGYFGCSHVCEPPGILESTSPLWGLIAYLLIFFVIKPHPIVRATIGLIAIITFVILFSGFGMLCPACPSTCTFSAGISCISNKISASGGNLTLVIGQGTGHTINITGVACSDNMSSNYMPASVAYRGGGSVLMNSGGMATVAQPGGSMHVECTSGGKPIVNAAVGSFYINGRIYVNYTETDTGIQHVVIATFRARYEA